MRRAQIPPSKISIAGLLVRETKYFKHFFIVGFLKSLLEHVEQVKTNAAKTSTSGFVDSLREAANGSDYKLWGPVVSIDLWRISLSTTHLFELVVVFHTVKPEDPNDLSDPSSSKTRILNQYRIEGEDRDSPK